MKAEAQGASEKGRFHAIAAGLIGNILEWYDFAVYGYFAAVIGKQFFPSDNPAVSLIAAFGAFAAGFLVRPLGGLVFGHIGDMVGRKRALNLSVVAMAVPTVLIACLPTYESIGVLAPIAIVALRIVQGLSVGGEYTSSLIFLAEQSKPGRRAFTAIWGMWGATAGILLGSFIGGILTGMLDDQQVMAWGWRLPFALGFVVAITGVLIRKSVHVEDTSEKPKSPVREVFAHHKGAIVRVALINLALGTGFYAVFVYAVTYIKTIDQLSSEIAFNLNTLSMLTLLLLLPACAWLSDRLGRKPLLIAGSFGLAFGAIPLFSLIHHTDPGVIFLGELGFVLSVSLISGGTAGANVELIPGVVRCTGLAFAYNLSIGYFGGTTPMIAAWLIDSTGNPLMPGYWVAATSLVTLITVVFFVKETAFDPLP